VRDGDAVPERDAVADGSVPDGAPTCAFNDDATDDALDDAAGTPDESGTTDDFVVLEQPASIASTATLTPADRRPRIVLL
jgi:hypothetical protein